MTDTQLDVVKGVDVVAMARPGHANALRRDTIRELHEAIKRIEDDTTRTEPIKGVIITGQGARFSAGADISELSGTIDDLDFDNELEALTHRITHCPFPVVAAVEGACFGAAIDLAWSCDLVVLSSTTRLGLPATRLGILYNPVSLARLHARLGSAAVRRLVIAGAELDGATVGATSGAAQVVEPGTAFDTAVDLLSRGTGVPEAVSATKALLAALDASAFDPSAWEARRRVLLGSQHRKAALQDARAGVKGNLS